MNTNNDNNRVRRRTCGDERRDEGFTLIEILIAIVLVGILSAVVVIGISSLTDKGSDSACKASLDAAKAGSVVYYTTHDSGYPSTFDELVAEGGSTPAALEAPSGAKIEKNRMIVGDWTLTLTSNGAKPPTFECSTTP